MPGTMRPRISTSRVRDMRWWCIDSMEIIAGSVQAHGYDDAMRWAVENRAAIRAAWDRLNGGRHEG